MRILGAFTLAFFASTALGAEANSYVCKGEGVEVRMSTTGYAGMPTLTVTSVGGSSENRLGGILAHVTRADNEMGISVTGHFLQIADATLAYTLIVPRAIVRDEPLKDIEGILVRSLAGTMPPPNPTSTYPHTIQHNIYTRVVCDAGVALF